MTTWTERRVLDALHARFSVPSHRAAGNGARYVLAEHVRSAAGFMDRGAGRTADALVLDLWPSSNELHGFEVKVSRSDWLTELRDPSKADAFRRYCDRWWLVVPDLRIVRDDLPDGWGLMHASEEGARVKVQAPRLTPEPLPRTMLAPLLRATVKTAIRALPANPIEEPKP